MSVACEHGREKGIVKENPVRGVKRLRRPRTALLANRPWTEDERRTVLADVPFQLRVPVALAMFTGLRKGDVLSLTKSAIRDGRIWRRTSKTGQEVSIPVHPDLARLLAEAPRHDAITVAATSNGTPWTTSGFNSTFIKTISRLTAAGRVQPGLTFHGPGHTVGTALVEAGCDIDTVRRCSVRKRSRLAIHYLETADDGADARRHRTVRHAGEQTANLSVSLAEKSV
jgi:integrase